MTFSMAWGGEAPRGRHGFGTVGGSQIAVERRDVAYHHVFIHAVVRPFEFGDSVSAGEGAGGADGIQDGFGTRAAEAYLFKRSNTVLEKFGHFDFEGQRPRKARAEGDPLLEGGDDFGMRVAQDEGGVVVHEIEKAVAVQIDEMDAFAAFGVDRVRVEMHAGARVPARKRSLGAPERLAGTRVVVHVFGNLSIQGGLEVSRFHEILAAVRRASWVVTGTRSGVPLCSIPC